MALLALPTAAEAAYPGSNGKIAFVRNQQIWTVNANGSGAAQLTTASSSSLEPQWSPDGTKIAYTRRDNLGNSEIRIMDADGTNDVPVPVSICSPTCVSSKKHSPSWSPNGRRIAYVVEWDASVGTVGAGCCIALSESNLDGSQRRFLYSYYDPGEQWSAPLSDSGWSPRGNHVAVREGEFPFPENPDASHIRVVGAGKFGGSSTDAVLNPLGLIAAKPSWSPDAAYVTYTQRTYDFDTDTYSDWEIYRVDPNAPSPVPITNNTLDETDPEWAPDGTKLVFAMGNLWLMNPDGTGRTQLTTGGTSDADPDWQPVVGSSPPLGYPRPKGASPLRVPLVPGFMQCSSANRTHGPPLAFPSCNPPVQSSPYLTTGTPDANGAAANMVSSLRLAVTPGNLATAADEADVDVRLDLTDVRCRSAAMTSNCPAGSNVGGDSDYTGLVTTVLGMRITDAYNLPVPGGRSAGTTQQIPFEFDAVCQSTSDTSTGSTCALDTTLDALAPGAVTEGNRANVELGQVEVFDRGDQGSQNVPPQNVFLKQGIFIP